MTIGPSSYLLWFSHTHTHTHARARARARTHIHTKKKGRKTEMKAIAIIVVCDCTTWWSVHAPLNTLAQRMPPIANTQAIVTYRPLWSSVINLYTVTDSIIEPYVDTANCNILKRSPLKSSRPIVTHNIRCGHGSNNGSKLGTKSPLWVALLDVWS